MATAFYTVRVENHYGEWFEFEYEYDFDPADFEGEFDPDDSYVERDIYDDVMQNMYVNMDFDRVEGLEED